MDLTGKTALVTGGAVRIGRAICEALADAGCNVAIHCNRSIEDAKQLTEALEQKGVRAIAIREDLAVEGSAERVIGKACDVFGRIQILVNNAAVFHKDSIASATEQKFFNELKINLLAPVELTRQFALQFASSDMSDKFEQQSDAPLGKVINLLDRRITSNESGCLPYVISKKALAEFTKSVALELAPAITVNGVAPGAILPPPGKGWAYVKENAGPVPMGVKCTPQDVAEAVVFLLKSDAVTGQVIFVDGGQHLFSVY